MKDLATEAVENVALAPNSELLISGDKTTVVMAVEAEEVQEATPEVTVVEITGTKDTEVEVDRAAEAIGGKPVGDLVMLWEVVKNFWSCLKL